MFTQTDAIRPTTLVAVLMAALILSPPESIACPFCLAPPRTWSEVLDDADIVVVAEFVAVRTYEQETRAETKFRIRSVAKGPGENRSAGPLYQGATLTLPLYCDARPGDLFLLTGRPQDTSAVSLSTFAASEGSSGSGPSVAAAASSRDPGTAVAVSASTESRVTVSPASRQLALIPDLIQWDPPAAVSPPAVTYILNSPDNRIPQRLRLSFFVPYLEHPDSEISIDAWAEFARSDYDDVKAVRRLFSPDLLRRWIADPQMSPERLGLYGMMLGLCGTESDAGFLRDQIGFPDGEELRFGVDGLMGGFLLLAGEPGLQYLERTRLRAAGTPVNDVVSVVYALRFIWSYEPSTIPRPRLRSAMRLVLNHDGLEETAITDLARWNDWSVMPQLIELHDQTPSTRAGLRRVIEEYARCCAAVPDSDPSCDPDSRMLAGLFLAALTPASPASASRFRPPN